MLASGALQFAFQKATIEGKITIGVLVVVSLVSWTVIFTKIRQLWRARKMARKFYAAYRETRDPLEIYRKQEEYDGAPANEIYYVGAEELSYHLKNSPVQVKGQVRVSQAAFDSVRVALERAVGAEGLGLEKGMIV
ncbi:MAG: MotA/TolQ/ExbB proton channel, partial [Pedosphaera sp.]|nr:MotA/TolQ/ExbB proton channel [Pedosphaera sp.]